MNKRLIIFMLCMIVVMVGCVPSPQDVKPACMTAALQDFPEATLVRVFKITNENFWASCQIEIVTPKGEFMRVYDCARGDKYEQAVECE